MDATPIDFSGSSRLGGIWPTDDDARTVAGPDVTAAERWTALHEAADVVATLAGQDAPANAASFPLFSAALEAASGARRHLAEQAIDDLCAIMQPGLAALLEIHGRGGDASAPARALQAEFDQARNAIVALLSPSTAAL